jgi:flavorubredoxin
VRVVLVVESMFGSTLRLAQLVAVGCASLDARCDVIEAGCAFGRVPPDRDLLVLASPTHLRHAPTERSRATAAAEAPVLSRAGVTDWLATAGLRRHEPVAVFDTRVDARWAGSAARVVARQARRAGGELLVPPASFVVVGRRGGPAPGEEDRAYAWGRELVRAVAGG